MSLVRNGVKAASLLKPVVGNITQKATWVAGPPRVRISLAEKSILAAVMIGGICAPSAYLMANIPYYREKGNK